MAKEQEKQVRPEVDRSIKTVSLTASGLITNKPCWLYSVIVGESTSAYAAFTLSDRPEANKITKLLLYVVKYGTLPVVFKHPIRFNHGLYLEFTTAGTYAFVQYREDY